MKNFYCTQGFRNPAVLSFSDAAALLSWGDTPMVADIVSNHRSGNVEAKKQLPCLIVGRLKAGAPPVRKDENFENAGVRLLDYDEECNPIEVAQHITDTLRDAGLSSVLDYSYMEESASGKWHMIAPAISDDVAADIEAYSLFYGLDFDRSVKNSSRLCALTFRPLMGSQLSNLEKDNTPARDALLANAAIQAAMKGVQETLRDPSSLRSVRMTRQDSALFCHAERSEASRSESYHGILYTDIIDAIIEEWGGEPVVGDRNCYLYRLTSELANICDCDPDWISQLLADYDWFGLPQEEAMASIRSACKAKKSSGNGGRQSRMLRSIIARLAAEPTEPTDSTDYSSTVGVEGSWSPFSEVPPAMPPMEKLPPFVRLLLSRTPSRCYELVLNGCIPGLAAYLDACTCKSIDGSIQHLNCGLLCAGIARMSSGKSSVHKPLDAILAPLKKDDIEARKALDEWNDLARRTKSSDLPEKPKFNSQLLGSDCTSAALISRLKDLDSRKSLILRGDELQMLTGLQSNVSGSPSPLPLILAFGREDLCVERSTEAGMSGSVSVRLNVSILGTPYQAQKFYAGGYHSGLLSRFSIATIHDDGSEFFYGNYDGFEELIAPYLELLKAEQGKHLSCKKIDDWARAMQKELLDLAAAHGSEALRNLSYRAVIAAQKKAYVWWLLNKKIFNKKLMDFLTWSLRSQIHSMFFVLGDLIAKEAAAEERASVDRTPGPQNLLTKLADEFTRQDVINLRQRLSMDVSNKALSRQLSAWKSRQLIEETPDGKYKNLKR